MMLSTFSFLIVKQPKIDEVHPIWLHLRIREFDPKFASNKKKGYHSNMPSHVADGKWTLGFQDAKLARLLAYYYLRKLGSRDQMLRACSLHYFIMIFLRTYQTVGMGEALIFWLYMIYTIKFWFHHRGKMISYRVEYIIQINYQGRTLLISFFLFFM